MNKVIYPIGNAFKKLPKIIELETKDAFGVLLHTRAAIEQFQINSGMQGKYTKEYQHHYWSAIARINIQEQVLDISIPLVMFNYEQVISTGDINFDLKDVTKVSNEVKELAMKKFDELKETKIYDYISNELGATNWSIIPMNTAHVHPGGENQAFSGIDLRKQADLPGVVYPLTIGINIPSFSAIMAHADSEFCKLVHSEYRIFIGTDDKKTYIKGRCATIVKGYEPEPLPRVVQPEPVEQRLIDTIFGIQTPQPTKIIQKEAKKKPSYVLRDELTLTEGKEFIDGLSKIWEETEYEPDTNNIKKENLKTEKPKRNNYNHNYNKNNQFKDKSKDKKKKDERNEKEKDKFVPLYAKRKYIVDNGYSTWIETANMPDKELLEFYDEVVAMEKSLIDEDNDNIKTQYNYMNDTKDYDDYHDFIEQNKQEDVKTYYSGQGYDSDEITKIRFLLEEEGYLSFAKINQMTDYNILAYFVNFYNE